jgi:hypothetical protein
MRPFKGDGVRWSVCDDWTALAVCNTEKVKNEDNGKRKRLIRNKVKNGGSNAITFPVLNFVK